jgi:hypothetical protein
MKKIIIAVFIAAGLVSCEKKFRCEQTLTKTVKGVVVYQQTYQPYYVDEVGCVPCNCYEFKKKIR